MTPLSPRNGPRPPPHTARLVGVHHLEQLVARGQQVAGADLGPPVGGGLQQALQLHLVALPGGPVARNCLWNHRCTVGGQNRVHLKLPEMAFSGLKWQIFGLDHK